MIQSRLSSEGKEHHSRWRTKRLVSKDGTSACLINGIGGVQTSETANACTLCGPTPPCGLNGYIKHNCKSKGTKEKSLSATNELAAGCAGGVLDVNVTGVNDVAHSHEFDRVEPDHGSLTSKHNRRRKNFKRKKKTRKDEIPPAESTSPVMPLKDEENWENEIREVTLHNWEKLCFGVQPYGPEELLHFALRGTPLTQRDAGEMPVTVVYNPKVHHPPPVKWSCCSMPLVPEQFADADE